MAFASGAARNWFPVSGDVGPARSRSSAVTPYAADDLWARLRAGFALPAVADREVRNYQRWYASRPHYLTRVFARGQLYLHHIAEEVERRGLPMELALLPAVESGFLADAESPAGAAGLWQFIPSTGRRFGLEQNEWYDGRRDVVDATRAALDYLEFLHDEFHGDWFHALAAYNAGEARVAKAIARNQRRGRSTHFLDLELRSETRRYVPKLIALRNLVAAPEKFGITLSPLPNTPYFAAVTADSQIDLGIAAALSQTRLATLRQLNAAFLHDISAPSGPHRVLLPLGGEALLRKALTRLAPEQLARRAQHRVAPGEYLALIARKYDTDVETIKRANDLRSDLIRVGQLLTIPMSGGAGHRTVAGLDVGRHRVHRVRAGDTLWGIAQRYEVYVAQLAHWNALHVDDVLTLNQQLIVYEP